MNQEEWVTITTIDECGNYDVELEIYSSRIRHRKFRADGAVYDWIPGKPLKDKKEDK